MRAGIVLSIYGKRIINRGSYSLSVPKTLNQDMSGFDSSIHDWPCLCQLGANSADEPNQQRDERAEEREPEM